MELLRSSIYGQEYINYRKYTEKNDRINFSKKIRSKGNDLIPIVIGTVDQELYFLFPDNRGTELTLHKDNTIYDILNEIKIIIIQKYIETRESSYEEAISFLSKYNFVLCPEDASIIFDNNMILSLLYKKYKNSDDNIFYILLSKENSLYNFILSIIKFLFNKTAELLGF